MPGGLLWCDTAVLSYNTPGALHPYGVCIKACSLATNRSIFVQMRITFRIKEFLKNGIFIARQHVQRAVRNTGAFSGALNMQWLEKCRFATEIPVYLGNGMRGPYGKS